VKREDLEPILIGEGRTLQISKVVTEQEKSDFIQLCQEFPDVFAWSYEDLRGLNPKLAQHTIELDPDAKPIRKKQRPVNPHIEPLMKKELKKLIEVNIIFLIMQSSWVANLVPVRKKSGEI
ncbi:hypothetical protein KI387_044660, partial [Taxus chinensis]